ncbi:hypothetical protein DICSQDRAFT_90649 [Dichomitus squalens LYAD-421 SS1]|uniref:Methyltransferase domain-containing protein n=1 Tax=Dichomitus squalens (strain LYAD-421) TaxID=732165 RepID=R7SRQ1_DICSQ|nr:uncharacterized protein DICSQDRAFT_90649 [Dichomitus squalens LYAD-421 SS1]EJF58440.1 hypothetical protein DICSQDRAFT_90649 [Dichomitus squalens LYAD-421 SS1]
MSSTADAKREIIRSRPLDENDYKIDEDGLAFMKAQTGIEDEEELKKHILAVQAEAYEVHPYPCIRRFTFLQMKLASLPAYERLLTLGKERKDPILLDIGCCFGNDIRKAIHDGFPREGVIASDLHPEFWDLGHKLFKTTQETFPVPFIAGDAFDPAFLEVTEPFYSPPSEPRPANLSSIKSLNPLRGHVSAIHASSFFHLFSEDKQFQLAKSLAGLLSPEPGSMLLGTHGGRPEKGFRTEQLRPNSHGSTMFCHSPESWAELWDGQIFKKGTVKVEARLVERGLHNWNPDAKFYFLAWSVTRL